MGVERDLPGRTTALRRKWPSCASLPEARPARGGEGEIKCPSEPNGRIPRQTCASSRGTTDTRRPKLTARPKKREIWNPQQRAPGRLGIRAARAFPNYRVGYYFFFRFRVSDRRPTSCLPAHALFHSSLRSHFVHTPVTMSPRSPHSLPRPAGSSPLRLALCFRDSAGSVAGILCGTRSIDWKARGHSTPHLSSPPSLRWPRSGPTPPAQRLARRQHLLAHRRRPARRRPSTASCVGQRPGWLVRRPRTSRSPERAAACASTNTCAACACSRAAPLC